MTTPDSAADAISLPTMVRERTVAEREAEGRAARTSRPRMSLSAYETAVDRADPVALLASQETVRVPGLLPLRHARMAVSPFTFYRGSAIVMADDLATMPNTGLITQLCGDAHLSNFGLFAAPDRSVVFDINDFDETNPGPFEWDVYRLATSFVLAGRDARLPEETVAAAAEAAANAYRSQMQAYAQMPDISVWYDRIGVDVLQQWAENEVGAGAGKVIAKSATKARSRDAWSAISKLTEIVDGRRQFLNSPPLLMRIPLGNEASSRITTLVREYQSTLPRDRQLLLNRYHVIDFGHKVVGVGSVGLLAFVVLLEGRDENDLMVLQVKQAVKSVLEPNTAPSAYDQSGERVVVGQQIMQAASDVFLGWIRGPGGRDYYIRQLRDMKYAPDPSRFTAPRLLAYAAVCGRALARAHARSGDSVAISSYLGTSTKFDTQIRDFALTYSRQVESDFAEYTRAIASGAVPVAAAGSESSYSFSIVTTAGSERIVFGPASGSAAAPTPETS